MRILRAFLTVFVAAAALAGCAAEAAPSTSPTPSAPAAATSSPASVVVSTEGISVRDAAGAELDFGAFLSPPDVVDLLGGIFGVTPPGDYSERFDSTSYDWPGVSATTYGDLYTFVWISAPEIAGLPVATEEGIHVGSSRADVESLGLPTADLDWDGVPDQFAADPVDEPTVGDEHVHSGGPGDTSMRFVGVWMKGDAVDQLRAPDRNYGDL